jgi:hypothetical protein
MGKGLSHFSYPQLPIQSLLQNFSVQREAVQYIYDHCPGLADKISIDDFLEERNKKQDELFAKVQPMEGAVEVIKHLVCDGLTVVALLTTSSAQARYPHRSRDRFT